MDRLILICGIFVTTLLIPTNEKVVRSNRTFVRDAIESPPQNADTKSPYIASSGLGSKFLPLRNSVEKIPDVKEFTRRLPLRDAVEKRVDNLVQEKPVKQEHVKDTSSDISNEFSIQKKYGLLQSFLTPAMVLPQPVIPIAVLPEYTHYSPYSYFTKLVTDTKQASEYRVDNKDQQLLIPLYSLQNSFVTNTLTQDEVGTSGTSKKIVCYIESSAVYRREPFSFSPNDLDPFACTHVVYVSATIDPKTFKVIPRNKEYDTVQGGYRSAVALKKKNPNLKVLIAVGEKNGNTEALFETMMESPKLRQDFIRSLANFLYHYQFDGVDFHWQFPENKNENEQYNEKEHFGRLLEEMYHIFHPQGWLIAVSAPPSRYQLAGLNLDVLAKTVEFVNVEAYDFQRYKEPAADHHAPFNSRPHDNGKDEFYNFDYAAHYWLHHGFPRSKLVMGIPLFGRSYTLSNPRESEEGARITGVGRKGEYTETPGFLAYFEICNIIKQREIQKQTDVIGSPYIVDGDQWVGYDDSESIEKKVLYIREMNLGGASLWTADLDDYKGLCGEKWPLLSTINNLLRENDSPSIYGGVISKPFQKCTNDGVFSNIKNCAQYFECRDGVAYQKSCSNDMLFNVNTGSCDSVDPINCRPGQQVFFPSSKSSEVYTRPRTSESNKLKVVCYITSWSFYRKSDGKFVPENIDPKLCTHVVYAFAILDSKNLTITEFDSNADLDNNLYRRVTSIRGVTSLLGIGGWIDSAGNKYSRLVRREGNRHKFITNVIVYLKRHGFNGLHFDWNYPVCWQSNCRRGPDSDKSNFVKLIKELKDEFDKQDPPLVLAASISGYKEVIDDAYDIPALSSALDFMSVMTYDYHGSWENVTGYVSPLYAKNNDRYPQFNTNFTMNYLVSKGAPREKLLVSIPFYGHTYTLVDGETTSENEAADSGPGEPGEYTNQTGMLAYYEVCDKIKNKRWTLRRVEGLGPCAFSKTQWVSFEDPQSVKEKARYIRSNGFGGAVAWTVDVDDFNNKCCRESFPLLKALHRGLGLMADEEVTSNCNRPAAPLTPEPPKSTTGFDTSAESSTWDSHHDPDSHTSQKPSSTKNPLTTTENDSPSIYGGVISKPFQKCTNNGVFSNIKDCAQYFECRDGVAYQKSCSNDMLFNVKTGSCDSVDPINCRPGQQVFFPSSKPSEVDTRLRASESVRPKVVCYITSWSFYRKSDGKFVPENIDPKLCTHVVYAFAILDSKNLTITEFDSNADLDNNLYERVTSIRGVTSLLGIGGWVDSAGNKYSRLVRRENNRRKFVTDVVRYLKKYGFDGLHFDWNYPVCWQSNCRRGPDSDKSNFVKLIKELKDEFDEQDPPLVLAASISGYKEVIDDAYDIPALSSALDFMSVMTYDYHGSWENVTGYVSPLYAKNNDRYPQYNTNYTMNYLVSKGAPREKLLVSIPFYGHTYTLVDGETTSENEAADSGPGEPGEYTNQPGMLAYYEVCDKIKNKRWTLRRVEGLGPCAFSKKQWVSFEDPQSVKEKARYIRSHGFGGAVAWTVDLDDFNNKCCRESFPLLKALHRGLGLMADEEVTSNCNRPAAPLTPEPPKSTTGFDTSAESSTWDSHHDHDSHTSQKPSTTKNPLTTTKQSTNVWWELSTDESTSTEWWKPSTSKKTTTTSKTTTPWRVPSSSRPTKTTTKKPNQTKPTPAAGDHKPEKCYTNQYKSDPYNCNAYYRCIQGEFSQLFCAGGLHWNNNKKVCDWPAAAKCKEISAQAPSVSTTTQRTTSKMPTTSWWEPSTQSTKPPKKCETGQYYPHEHCDSFYVCVNGLLLTQKCGPGLYWNAADSRCDWRFRAKCIEGAASEALDRYTKVPAGSATNIQSSCSSGSYSALKGSCEKYLYCLWGKYELFACSSGLHWNKEKNVCDWPQNAKCSESSENPDIDNINEVNHEHPTSRPTVKPSTSKPKPKPTTSTSTTTRKPWEWKPESTTANQWDWKPTKPTFTTTTAEPPAVPYEPLSGYFKIVCYFTNWAWYRQGVGKYVPENINPDLCTHIVYGFAVLDTERLVIKAHDSWADFDNYFYERVVEFKKAGKKVTLAIGGWNDSLGDKYSRLVNNPSARARFIQHVIEFLEKHNFDGLDLDWEYPKCWQVDCKKGPDSDKPAFAAFVKELKEAFKPKSLLLSAAVSPSKTVIDAGYDVATVAKYLDWIAVMTYDFHGQWDKQTGHVAPLYVHPEDENVFFNANFSINYWISQGAPRRKIIMGMPLYGQSFQLEKADNHGLNAKAPGPGQAGEFTRAAGFLAYYEICNKIKKEGWTVVQDPKRRMGPYAYKGNQWVSYDDQEQIRIKSEYIRKMDLGGGMIWALDLDDFNNRCGEGKHPLLSIIRRVLAKPGSGAVEVPQYVKPELPDSDKETTELTQEIPKRPGVPDVSLSTSTPSLTEPNSEYKVICYFTNWAWYRPGVGRYLPGNVDPNLCTHLVYGFAILDEQQMTIKIHDTWTDIENDFYGKITKYRKNGIKVLIAIGGWNDSEGDKYSRLVNDPEARKKFIENVVQFIEEHNFDGLDLDWEYPKCWQGDCRLGPASDKPAFAEFVRELKEAFSPKNFLLSSAVSPSSQIIDVAYDVPELSKYLDWIGIMNYDYHGQWDKVTGHVSPMYVSEDDADITFNTNYSVNYWIEQGADRRKLILGMPTYGQSFTLSDPSQNSLNAPSAGGGEAGEHTRAMGFLAYYEICNNILKRGWNVVRDPEGRMGPYAYSGNQWVSFDDTNMIRHKAEYIKRMGLGGGMIWALDLDDFSNYCGCEKYPLLRTINRVLRNYPIPPPKCNLESNVVTTGDESTPSPTDSDNGGSDEELVCDGSQIFMSHSTNCNQYYLCNQGMYELQTCPSGLYWNVKNCDWPENTPCSSTNSVNGAKLYRRKGSENFVEGQIDVSNDGYKVVCYFANWAWYRQHPGKYTPEDIDASLCTHIIYGFAVLDSESLTIKPYDNWTDIDNDLFRKVAALRTKGVKVSIALGSWNDSLGDKYSRLVSNAQYRTRFVENVIQFIEKWNFNGLDLHWMYPKCWQMDCEKGPDTDKIGFGELIEELSLEFKPRGLLLSAAVSPNKTVIDAAYDVPKLDMYLDWMTVRDYDIFGSWDSQSGPLGRLYRYSRDQDNNYNSNFSLNYWIQKGASPNKLIMDIPFYGYSFTLANSRNNVLNVTSVSPGTAGQFTKAEGFLAFYEICDMINNEKDWKVIHDPAGRIGSNATKEYQWMSYDDISDIKRISEYLKDMGLGGAMVWSLDLDDFRNRCGCGDYPLLKTVNYVLRGFPLTTTHENCT